MNIKNNSQPQWKQQHVLILGAARQGLAAVRYLLGCGAEVTINDQKMNDEVVGNLKTIQDSFPEGKLHSVLGKGHPIELLDGVDKVCLSGGIPLTIPLVQEAARREIPLTNDSQILMEAVPCKVIGITGSAGKTTTTTLVARMMEHWVSTPGCPYHRAWVGGNIGNPLIELVGEMQPHDLVILELSSFQLEQMTISPHISAVLNVTPNHLDRHGTMEAYAAAKANILTHQNSSDWAVLNREEPGSWNLSSKVPGKLATFGINPPTTGNQGVVSFYLDREEIVYTDGSEVHSVLQKKAIFLRGEHNLANVLAACTIAHIAGAPVESIQAGVYMFGGVAHRLEFVRQFNGADWYNDSIATAPERTLAAVHSFDQPLVMLLGGRDKNLNWDTLSETLLRRAEINGVRHILLFGETAEKIIQSFINCGKRLDQPIVYTTSDPGVSEMSIGKTPITRFSNLEEAVRYASHVSCPGDVVLLSPGGTSFDAFKDFEQRGECFRAWVNQLQ